MTPKNSAWNERREVKIGDYGELLVKNYLKSIGWNWSKFEGDCSHPFDFLISKPGEKMMAVEVKTKPHRWKYPDTGFNFSNHQVYINVENEHNMKMFVFFVDESKAEIYGNYLHELEKPRKVIIERTNRKGGKELHALYYPLNQRGDDGKMIRYYPLKAMKLIRILTSEEISEFKRLRGVKS